jgi:hypothetical protein
MRDFPTPKKRDVEEPGVIAGIRSIVQAAVPDPYNIMRELDKIAIMMILKENYRQTGVKLPKDLRYGLIDKYCLSGKTIELIAYESEYIEAE